MGLTLAVGFCTMPASRARCGRVVRVYRVQGDASKGGFVGEEETQLEERPVAMATPLRVSNRAFRAGTDVP